MAANTSPIYSAFGDIQGGDLLTTAAADYTGQGVNNVVVFQSDLTNGGFIQRLRFKAYSANNAATVARIYYNNGNSRFIGQVAAPTGTPTGTPSASGGTLASGTYFAKIVSVDQYTGRSIASTESASVSVTGPTGSIAWSWTAATGAVGYRVYVGPVTNGQLTYFETTTNSYSQTNPVGTRDSLTATVSNNNALIGELSLPATTAITTAATVDIDYPLNFALPPGGRILVGLGATVVGGWTVTGVGGEY
jgi:hypothetical protein